MRRMARALHVSNFRQPKARRSCSYRWDDAESATVVLPEWNVRVSEREQVVAQTLVDLRPGPGCR